MSQREQLRVLLVDDEPLVLEALSLVLQALGYSVTAFQDPLLADSIFKQQRSAFDLILCDLMMPGMSGLELLESVRYISPNIRFILMSAHASGDEVQYAKRQGATGFLAKPFTPIQLSCAIDSALAELAA